ncbi:hypothetical protein IGI04_024765 [Brassica rapa subsp. trilocularis]|uniref:Uncharacterized protein n=1 Tax=Brassica rapa subsp. trilocularis TaxID=1813537 RepID=A0ABQ7M7M8_BRACM|nr:hypothetical protein IGI04_024765 [Brassica rapa subsp. trilocularis]
MARQGGWAFNTSAGTCHRPPRFTGAHSLKSLQRNHIHSTPLCLHAGEFHRSNKISSDYKSPQTLDRRAENHYKHEPSLSHLDLITTTQRTSGFKMAVQSFANLHSPAATVDLRKPQPPAKRPATMDLG